MADVVVPREPLPVSPVGRRASGWYGMALFIATEAALFAYLLFSYFLIGSQAPGQFPPGGPPEILIPALNTLVLLASSVAAWFGQSGVERGDRGRLVLGLSGAIVLGALFVGVQAHEWTNKDFGPSDGAYGSLYFTITGAHIAHVVVGLLMLAAVLVWTLMGRFDRRRHLHVDLAILYWHFVDIVWLFVFTTFFITPRLGLS